MASPDEHLASTVFLAAQLGLGYLLADLLPGGFQIVRADRGRRNR